MSGPILIFDKSALESLSGDEGWYFIWMLEAIGLAHSVKRPRAS